MKPHRVEIRRGAARQIAEAIEWWRGNRPDSPDLLERELEGAVLLLESQPEIGARASNTRLPDVRRLLLATVAYHVYYRVQSRKGVVQILALWHTRRGHGPQV